MKNFKYIAMTESALDSILLNGLVGVDGIPVPSGEAGVYKLILCEDIVGFHGRNEGSRPHVALVSTEELTKLVEVARDYAQDVYRRIARVLKGFKSPPVHLPRQWSEYHHKNFVAFFALPKNASGFRWVAEADNSKRCVRFDFLSSDTVWVDLTNFVPATWPSCLDAALAMLADKDMRNAEGGVRGAFAEEVDLQAIGSSPVVRNRTYEEWQGLLSDDQKNVLNQPINSSVRIIGPAGSGKTLALCLRAIQIARDNEVSAKGKKVLIATHSWAMTERVDGILSTLNAGASVDGITVFPLISLLQLHAGGIGRQSIDVIGDDSTDGRIKSIEIIRKILSNGNYDRKGLSEWIHGALASDEESRSRVDLLFNLYEEISGVLTASGVALDDQESVQSYLTGRREDWMPPFVSVADRRFVIGVYKEFLRQLVDRASITTDQFVIDSIRILETFTWRMRKETEGYDFILVDELQLFDSQERSVLELLGRSRKGVPFITAEDPSQGVFSALHSRNSPSNGLHSVYLDTIHRFDKGIFEFIKFIYQKFPLNTLPLRVDSSKGGAADSPILCLLNSDDEAIAAAVGVAKKLSDEGLSDSDDRICLATLGDSDSQLCEGLERLGVAFVQLRSFDDVEQLAYRKRSIVVSPWQFIGGTQFSHVVVVAASMPSAQSQFGKLRELIAVYLACSRAAKSLSVVCGPYVPKIVLDAKEQDLLTENK